MKYFIVGLLVLLAASSSRAQITLEHTYASTPALTLVDSGESKYVFLNSAATTYSNRGGYTPTTYSGISIYNLNHTLDKTIQLPASSDQLYESPQFITKKLFDLDGLYDYLIGVDQLTQITPVPPDTGSGFWVTTEYITRIYNENGKQLFSSDSTGVSSIFNTEKGAKLLLEQESLSYGPTTSGAVEFSSSGTSVYSLPGKLPGSMSKAHSGVIPNSFMSGGGSVRTSAYPNPSNGQVRIEYTLPDGVLSGELIITDVQGHELKRYQVGTAFNDILIEKSDLASGTYLYRIVTAKGESDAHRLVVLK